MTRWHTKNQGDLKYLFIKIIILVLSIANSNYKPLFISITNTYQGNLSNPLHFSYLAVGGFDWNLVFNWHGVCTLKILFYIWKSLSLRCLTMRRREENTRRCLPTGGTSVDWHFHSTAIYLHIQHSSTKPCSLITFICSIFGRLRNIAVQLYFISLVSFPITSLI